MPHMHVGQWCSSGKLAVLESHLSPREAFSALATLALQQSIIMGQISKPCTSTKITAAIKSTDQTKIHNARKKRERQKNRREDTQIYQQGNGEKRVLLSETKARVCVVSCLLVTVCDIWSPFRILATSLAIQLPPKLTGKQSEIAQAFVSLPSIWETRIEFLDPDSTLGQTWLWSHGKRAISLCIALAVFNSIK